MSELEYTKIKNYYGKYLTIAGTSSSTLSNHQNVIISESSNSMRQKWHIVSNAMACFIVSLIDSYYALRLQKGDLIYAMQ